MPFLLLLLLIWTSTAHASAPFTPLMQFGDNPGELTVSYFSPVASSDKLVVLLHGCEQSGEILAEQSGLIALAKEHKFSLLIPQQSYDNNIKKCFNWFSQQDTNQDSGEMLSIKNMVLTFQKRLKAKKIYILGLSAGGAMTSALLVNYPDMFTAGAVVAGLPFPCADSLIKAISCMRKGPPQPASELSNLVTQAKPHQKFWPLLTVWTGGEDKVVNPVNAQRLAEQWVSLKQIDSPPKIIKHLGYQTTQWQDQSQNIAVELVQIDNIGHGLTVSPKQKNGGVEAPFLLASPVSGAIEIIKFWKI
ncbi:alpha/beta hydrolase family esterase [Shewanella psychrophila]|nr:PHB depolymerase family esterase [Shewanella psychrophila]